MAAAAEMSTSREAILRAIREGYAGRDEQQAAREVSARIEAHAANLVPARGRPADRGSAVDQFVAMAQEADASVALVGADSAVPDAVAEFLRQHNLPFQAAMAPDLYLRTIPWDARPLLEIRRDKAEPSDETGIGTCFRAIAETGTLMALSGSGGPTTINFLPENHIVVLRAERIVGSFEDAIAALRAAEWPLPRTVNFITGPSRSADIEQTLQLGAHGPRRLHIIIVDEQAPSAAP
jgi:L-lactate dehydrogenase complex protein LldG